MTFTHPSSLIRRHQRGGALVEFVAVVPVLLVLLGLSVEFGRVLYTYHALTKAVHSAARRLTMTDSAIVGTSSAATIADWNQARQEACYLAVYGTLDAGDEPLAPGLTPAMVRIDTSGKLLASTYANSGVGCGSNCGISTVKVTVTGYSYTPMLGSLLPSSVLQGGKLPLEPIKLTMRSWPFATTTTAFSATNALCSAFI